MFGNSLLIVRRNHFDCRLEAPTTHSSISRSRYPARDRDSAFSRVSKDLQHLAFPELASALRDRIGVILKQWRERSSRAMPHLD
jgi:hypothetical protein